MLCKVTHCAGHILANTRPRQLHWCDWILLHDRQLETSCHRVDSFYLT